MVSETPRTVGVLSAAYWTLMAWHDNAGGGGGLLAIPLGLPLVCIIWVLVFGWSFVGLGVKRN
jgi:hypothetical protein